MLRVVRLARDRGERRRHLRVVEQRRLVLFDRVDQIELAALSRLVAVPKAVARLEPSRVHRRVEHETSHLLGGPLGREGVVGFRRIAGVSPRRGQSKGDDKEHEEPQRQSAPEGARVEVIVVLPAAPPPQRRSMLDLLAALPPGPLLFKTPEEANRYLQEERDAWER